MTDYTPIYSNAYVHELEQFILDLLDGSREWYEIQENTGLSDSQCRKMSDLYKRLYAKYYSTDMF